MSDSDANRRQRLFFALWPEPSLQERLHALTASVEGGRRIPACNLHLTLAFLGSVDAERRRCLEGDADRLRVPAFDLVLDRLGSFPRRGVLWVGASQIPDALRMLVEAIARAQSGCGVASERRNYRPHLTLMRDLRPCPPASVVTSVVWQVRKFFLVCSSPSATGSRYDVLRSWSLDPV